uniref:Ribosomal protein L32 n=1 Tax=Rhipiliopsis peltata TaxID=2320810 RepID=A0A386B1J9_9CHLO|nr:ribosomal protein L32 [Rhipiliopsis peltata]AYC65527.1 ribosomal protein L32 [Rhipiliopsis peltata]
MAVPKKRTSKSKSRNRKTLWKKKLSKKLWTRNTNTRPSR